METNYSSAEENYIKSIYHLQQHSGMVTTNELAAGMNTKPASVTDMLKKLRDKKLIHYQPYQGFKLSTEGKKIALDIIRKHRLWEFFLVEKLKFGWDEVHELAEQLEHISSKKLIDKLDAFLCYPHFDPHGDPIPDSNGKMKAHQTISLINLPLNQPAEICSVGSQSSDLLALLKYKNISIGTLIEVKKIFSFDNSIEIKIKNHPSVTLSNQIAEVLYVKEV